MLLNVLVGDFAKTIIIRNSNETTNVKKDDAEDATTHHASLIQILAATN